MHAVNELCLSTDLAVSAALMLLKASQDLHRLAREHPLEHWLQLASDVGSHD